ncbi:BRO-N domain-containing protein, partial [Limosilactobacillus fermentum]
MENQLQVFDFEGSNVRTVNIDGNPYFVGKDVATILGYKNTKDALLKHVDDEDKLGSQIATSGQNREMKVINESGLYSLILSSKLPSAKKFKRWVTSEVLPAIRKTGAYQAKPKDNYQIPATYGEALQLAATLQTKIEHDAPSLKYFHDQMRNP